jgi:hypothetical protein
MLTKNTEKLCVAITDHLAADRFARGYGYWNGERGCGVGCLTKSSTGNHKLLGDEYGIPLPVAHLVDRIFESVPADEAPQFMAEFRDAVRGDERDLTRVHWAFLGETLRRLPGSKAPHIANVIAGMDLLASGQEWPELEDHRAAADWAANWAAAVWAAAARAAEAVVAAAEAAASWTAEVKLQRQSFLRLIREAA